MPQNTTLTIPEDTITLITTNDVTAVRIQNISGNKVYILGTFGTTAPNSNDGGIVLMPNQIIGADILLSELFAGITNVNRLWAYSDETIQLSVSHA